MAIELTEKPPIDDRRAAILAITPELVGVLLGIPEGNEVRRARISVDDTIELLVYGVDMPLAPSPDLELDHVSIVCTQTMTPDGRKFVSAMWRHLPDKTWAMK